MKLLFVAFDHLKMFKNGKFELDFFASDRVPSDDQTVYRIAPPLYTNKVIALAGINASGKTSALDLLRFALIILSGRPVSGPFAQQISDLFYGDPTFTTVFWDEGVWVLASKLSIANADSEYELGESSFVFEREALYRYSGASPAKKLLGNIDELLRRCELQVSRKSPSMFGDDQFISPTVSVIATKFDQSMNSYYAGPNAMRLFVGNAKGIDHFLHVLDSNIEYLRARPDDSSFDLKFRTEKDPVTLDGFELNRILSSGTMRGVAIMGRLLPILRSGGYLLVDEIENHLNKQLVNVIIDLFSSNETNPNGAVLVFSTHYPEVLDQVHRKDNVYFLVRDDSHTTRILKYTSEVKRIENKKSEVFVANIVKGTAPKYSDVKALRQLVCDVVNEVEHEATAE